MAENKQTQMVRVETPIGALRISDGELRRGTLQLVRKVVSLRQGEHYTDIQGKCLLSPAGADELNAICGLQIIELVGAGYREDKKDANGYSSCTRSVMVAGYSPTGRPIVVGPVSLTFQPGAYFLHAIGKKVSKSGPVRIGAIGSRAPEEDGNWIFFPVDNITGLWANVTHSDVLGNYTAYLQDRKFADRRCLGILRRNAMTQHPGGPMKYVQASGKTAQVAITGWVPEFEQDMEDLRAQTKAAAEASDPRQTIDAEYIDCPPPTDEEVNAELSAAPEPEGPEDVQDEAPEWFGQDK